MKIDSHYQYHIYFLIFDCVIHVHCNDSELVSILEKLFKRLQLDATDRHPDLDYKIGCRGSGENRQIYIICDDGEELVTNDIGEFVFLLEKDMTIELQKIRSDLLFVHSAALEYQGKGFLIVAPSGTGKSTTTWGLLNMGANYLSDELAPVDPKSMTVYPYPHSICLKARPPMFELPKTCLFTSQTIHVYGSIYLEKTLLKPVQINAIIFLEHRPEIKESEIFKISRGEAAMILYANSLNILAHANSDYGIEAAISLVTNTHNYRLLSNRLDDSCNKIKSLIQSI